jgi:cytochrome c
MRLAPLSILAVALMAGPSLAAPTPGETVFLQRCGMCHAIDPAPGKMGPPLRGVVARKAGATPGYAYSDAMKRSAVVWTPAQLDRFLKSPTRTIPGAKMTASLPDAKQRAAVVAYLGTLKRR